MVIVVSCIESDGEVYAICLLLVLSSKQLNLCSSLAMSTKDNKSSSNTAPFSLEFDT